MVKAQLEQAMFTIEFDVLFKTNFEVTAYKEEQLPIALANRAISEICHEKLAKIQAKLPQAPKSLRIAQETSMQKYEETWTSMCHKLALDTYRRPVCFVVPPQLMAATLVYVSELFILRLALFKASAHMPAQTELAKLTTT